MATRRRRSTPTGWREPMLAVNVRHARTRLGLVTAEGWVLERKFDGLRCLAVRHDNEVNLWSRNRLSYNGRFPAIVRALAALPAASFEIDGEVTAFDERGRSSFSLLQRHQEAGEARDGGIAVAYCVFDLLALLGRDTTGLPLADRRTLLRQLLPSSGVLQLPEEMHGDPGQALARACSQGWEGLIAKREGSTYRPGRSSDWLKLKCVASQDVVIGGWTASRGSRQDLGALLVGYHDEAGLHYAGKVGTGFSAATLARLRGLLEDRAQDHSPFVDPVREKGARWARPDLVAAVGFSEWTTDGRLRHPRFEGLLDDKDPQDVVREDQV
jgi:DNA ligase D-like protein (predicted ligase)